MSITPSSTSVTVVNGRGGLSGGSIGTPRNPRPDGRTTIKTTHNKQNSTSTTLWNGYDYSKPPTYPDTSFQAYLRAGGNLLGIGYLSWKNKREADYQTAYQLYQQYYDSASQQFQRIAESPLNTNLAYGSVTPGSAAGSAPEGQPLPSPAEVASQASSVLSGITSSAKTLIEAKSLLNELPASKFKGQVAKALDVAAAAQGINSENLFKGQLNSALVSAGVGTSEAQARKTKAVLQDAQQKADKSLLDYMTSHSADGSESDFEGSVYARSQVATRQDAILSYRKHKQEWDKLLSKPEYYKALLDKAVADGDISKGQAWKYNQILNNQNMSPEAKLIALQDGLPGFFAKVAFEIESQLIDTYNSARNSISAWFNK